MAGAKVTGVTDAIAKLRTQTQRMRDEAADITEESAQFGADLMKEYIATRGTGYVGKGSRATPEGRIDTGQMYDDVDSTHVRQGKSETTASFGWVGHFEDYYKQQEEEPTPGGFPPMHALLDAAIRTREHFYTALKRRF